MLVIAVPAQAELVTVHRLPPSLSWVDKIAAGPDGAMWFTQSTLEPGPRQQLLLGRIATDGAVSTRALALGTSPTSLTIGPDGALWYATRTASGAGLGRVTADAIGELPLPGLRNAIDAVTGPDHALWFTAIDSHGRDRIGRVAAGGGMVTFPVPGGASVKNIVSGPGRALWVGLDGGVGRVDLTGRLRRFPLPIDDVSSPDDIVAGPDGALWIADGLCCVMRMTTAGHVRSFVLPRAADSPGALAVGSDGAIWYAGAYGIGRITTTGEITDFQLPDLDFAEDLASGADGAMWFSVVHLNVLAPHDPSNGSSAIGRIDVRDGARRFLVARLTDRRLRGRAGGTLRVHFTTTRRAGGTVQVLRGETVVARARVRAGATTASVRLPRRRGSYRVVLRLRLPAQAGSDEARVRVTQRR